ncbi:hypothetical protein L596_010438 [Steinernema carpocapsae]|uniref:CCHC-type domain-containing protein n=1 Tax=Steinernema carpocapsae TaxID=34508 RepID=A0A4U5PID5_STECR|nr:hypothetical protein L596_010438 [Steinernema carpocapsae]
MTVPTAMLLLRQLDKAVNLAFETMGLQLHLFDSVEKTIGAAYKALESLISEAGNRTRATIQGELGGWLDKAEDGKPRTKEALSVVLKQERSILAEFLQQLNGICDEILGNKKGLKTTTGARAEDFQEEELKNPEEEEAEDSDKDVEMKSRSPSKASSSSTNSTSTPLNVESLVDFVSPSIKRGDKDEERRDGRRAQETRQGGFQERPRFSRLEGRVRRMKSRDCAFCYRGHFTSDCPEYYTLKGRLERARDKELCQVCLVKHKGECRCLREGHRCFFCRASGHHSALCARGEERWNLARGPSTRRARQTTRVEKQPPSAVRQWAPNRMCEEYRSLFKARTSRRDPRGLLPRKTVEAEACC